MTQINDPAKKYSSVLKTQRRTTENRDSVFVFEEAGAERTRFWAIEVGMLVDKYAKIIARATQTKNKSEEIRSAKSLPLGVRYKTSFSSRSQSSLTNASIVVF